MSVTCAVCGRVSDPGTDGARPLGWSSEHDHAGTTRWICPRCTRENARAIEAKLDREWW